MTSVALLAPLFMRQYDTINSLFLSAFITLLFRPYSLFSLGFILSYLSAFSIFILPNRLEELYNSIAIKSNSKLLNSFINDIQYMSPFISVTLFTGFVLLYSNYYIYPYSLFINICIATLLAPLVVLAFLCGLIGLFSISLAQFISPTIYYILLIIESICRLFSKLPFNEILVGKPSLIAIILCFLLVYIIFFTKKYRKWLSIITSITIIFITLIDINSINIHLFNKDNRIVCIEDKSLVILDNTGINFYGLKKFIQSTGNKKTYIIITNSIDNALYLSQNNLVNNIYVQEDNPLINDLDYNEINYITVAKLEKFSIDKSTYFIDNNNVYIDFPNYSFSNIKDFSNIYRTNIQNNVQTVGVYDILIDTNNKTSRIASNSTEIKITMILDHIFIGEK